MPWFPITSKPKEYLSICADKCEKVYVSMLEVIFDRNGAKAYVKNLRVLFQRKMRAPLQAQKRNLKCKFLHNICPKFHIVVTHLKLAKLTVAGRGWGDRQVFAVYRVQLHNQNLIMNIVATAMYCTWLDTPAVSTRLISFSTLFSAF